MRRTTFLLGCGGDSGQWDLDAINQALDDGDEILNTNSQAIFEPMRPGRPPRIMVTLPGEAADDPEAVVAFVNAGMDVARINCAHDPARWVRMVGNVRAAATTGGRQVLVSPDLPGPKLRTDPSWTCLRQAVPLSLETQTVMSWPPQGSGSSRWPRRRFRAHRSRRQSD